MQASFPPTQVPLRNFVGTLRKLLPNLLGTPDSSPVFFSSLDWSRFGYRWRDKKKVCNACFDWQTQTVQGRFCATLGCLYSKRIRPCTKLKSPKGQAGQTCEAMIVHDQATPRQLSDSLLQINSGAWCAAHPCGATFSSPISQAFRCVARMPCLAHLTPTAMSQKLGPRRRGLVPPQVMISRKCAGALAKAHGAFLDG